MKVLRALPTALLTVVLFWATLWMAEQYVRRHPDVEPTAVLAQSTPTKLLPEEKSTIQVYQSVSPAVVNITSTTLKFNFRHNPVPAQGSGSGVLLTKTGYILTNHHVIENAKHLEVTLFNSKAYEAKLIGQDPSNDLALLKIEADQDLPAVQLGDSDRLLVGQNVYVIGNPYGLNSTLSRGVVSSLNRTLRAPNGRLIEGIIQTDAAINPGNSGGPMLDSAGNLIGITTAIFSPTGSNTGIGFAIPVKKAQKVANDLIQYGKVIRPYLGTSVSLELTPRVAEALHFPLKQGLMVGEVAAGSPAAQAGIQAGTQTVQIGNREILLGGDIILEADGAPVTSTDAFISLIESKAPGDNLVLTLFRNGSMIKVTLVLKERPENM